MLRRNRSLKMLMAAGLVAVCASGAQANVVFDWAIVGNAGNAGHVEPQGTFGAVSDEYRIATTEVTNAQYTEFLNAVAATDTNSLYVSNMGSDVRGGITQSGSSGSFTYSTKTNMGNKPVNFVSFFDSMRFVNWLENGQTAGGTESGVYTIGTGLNETRAAGAQFFLPSENEWYKAAYHQPSAQGGDVDDYWLYSTASNTIPTLASATVIGDIANPGTNVVNYTNGADWNGRNGNVTTVGSAGLSSASYYGTFDQGGNLFEWNETLITAASRGIRGGSWLSSENNLRSSFRIEPSPSNQNNFFGFRVASAVPEPSSLALLALGATVLLRRRRG